MEPLKFTVWPGDSVDKSMSWTQCNLLCGTSPDLGNLVVGVYSIYIGGIELWYTGTRICTLKPHRIPFSYHDALYRTTQQCLLQLATCPKTSNGAGPMIMYLFTRWTEKWLHHLSGQQPNCSDLCQVKYIFASVKASLFRTLSIFHILEVNTHLLQTCAYNLVQWISHLIELFSFPTAYKFCLLLYIFKGLS